MKIIYLIRKKLFTCQYLVLNPDRMHLQQPTFKKSAIKIEKSGHHFRFFYATGQADNFAFKEALSKELEIEPRYIGVFALHGFVKETGYIPARIKFFSLINAPCSR